ncbi:hypothetical protein [Synechococcus sp. A15-28]|uniref:hypothetical protein n=1 Tax=Synechococcus sp. A15-28 TaxID=1050638 RepID=UPI0016453910|nr:hypothetical protein [Synechococcus sp. A15-28]QNI42991.1 hypothetical protein SynA1528_01969 [Synechococcus sp. A15-28]
MESKRQLISEKEAAAILNRTPSAIYRALADNRLRFADERNRKLDRRNLEERFSRSTRPRADKPMASPAPVEQQPIHEDDWQEIAAVANELIDAAAWATPPPWTADRWAGLAGVLEIARIEVSGICGK